MTTKTEARLSVSAENKRLVCPQYRPGQAADKARTIREKNPTYLFTDRWINAAASRFSFASEFFSMYIMCPAS